ncbi:putative non-ribosomal peptide synthetase [Gordonia polyisoprenivorans VH2]|uniref:Putative non-ribosomal peptide synthetase n=1 Tax=Gordonia polyisoprenivorans (strain DSM 44266 / VH2) TaxID=1112204 RepID=H6MWP4_GORPV|nr:non-ribosomal peptide synthetase [Gordonia polyisoprenivorans]AFA75455.1 putative non-ribosomal peptide synthetase [Gordonia polyisoprenivorans VH2]
MTITRRALWLAQLLRPHTSHVIAFGIDLDGPLDLPRLRSSIDSVLAHVGWGGVHIPAHLSPADPSCIDPLRPTETSVPSMVIEDLRDHSHPDDESRRRAEHFIDCADARDLTSPLWASRLHILASDRHRWVLRVHHVLTDGAGAQRLMRHIGEVYAGSAQPGDLSVPTTDELTAIDHRYRSSPRFTADATYFEEALKHHSPSLLCATPTGPTSDVVRVTRRLGVTRSPETPEILAAFACLCARLLDTPDVGLSLPVAARTTFARRRALAPLSTVVPLTLPGIGDCGALDARNRMTTTIVRTLRHQLHHREDVLRHREDLTDFGAVANILPAFEPPAGTGLSWTVEVMRTGPVSDVAMTLHPDATDGLRALTWEAPAAAFDTTRLSALAARFDGFLGSFLHELDTQTPMAPEAIFIGDEWARFRHRSGPPAPEFTPTAALLDEVCRSDPNAPALIGPQHDADPSVLSWSDLRAAADRGAHLLLDAGVAPGDRVAVCLERSVSSVIAFWSVIRAGAVWVPVGDAFSPDARTNDIITRAGVSAVIGAPGVIGDASKTSAGDVRWLDLSAAVTADGAKSSCPERLPGLDRGPDDRAYILFTSGSTGIPKGVDMPHRGLPALVAEIRNSYALKRDSRMLHASAPTFDTGLVEVLSASATGAALVVAPTGVRGGDAMTRLIRRYRVTHIIVTPSVLGTLDPALTDQLAQVVLGGEPVPVHLVDRWGHLVTLRNAYGPTETRCSINFSTPLLPRSAVTVGPPMTGVTEAVLDRLGRPQPPEAWGILHCCGPQVADGYLDAPDLTATAFRPSTISDDDVMYCTGDIASWTADGEIRLRGRRDGQVKLRGLRIELGEIDAVIGRHNTVARCATQLRTLPSGRPALVTYVVAAEGRTSVDAAELRRAAGAVLPTYMVPSMFVGIDELPHTANDKLDSAALAAIPLPTRRGRSALDAREATLISAVSEALGVESADPDAGFLDQGGDSLAVMTAAALLKAAGHPEIAANDLLLGDTLAQVATRMRDPSASLAAATRPRLAERCAGDRPTRPEPHADSVIALTAAQRSVVRDPDDPCAQLIRFAWVVPQGTSLRSEADVSRLITELTSAHPALRSTHPDTSRGPVRHVHHSWPTTRVLRVAAVDGVDRDGLQRIVEDTTAGLDVRSQAPIAVTAVTDPAGLIVAVVAVLHHIAVDGRSLHLLAGDAARLAFGAPGDFAPSIPSAIRQAQPPTTFATANALDDEQERFWCDLLTGVDGSAWTLGGITPTDVAVAAATRFSATIPAAVTVAFTRRAAQDSVTAFEAFHAAVATALAEVTGDHRTLSATPVSRRTLDDANVVDDFVVTAILPLATDRSLHRIATDTRRCRDAAVIPMEEVLSLVGRPVDPDRLFPVPVLVGWDLSPPQPDGIGRIHLFPPESTRWLLQIDGTVMQTGELRILVTGAADTLGTERLERILAATVEAVSAP